MGGGGGRGGTLSREVAPGDPTTIAEPSRRAPFRRKAVFAATAVWKATVAVLSPTTVTLLKGPQKENIAVSAASVVVAAKLPTTTVAESPCGTLGPLGPFADSSSGVR